MAAKKVFSFLLLVKVAANIISGTIYISYFLCLTKQLVEREREYIFQVKTVYICSIIVWYWYLCPTCGATWSILIFFLLLHRSCLGPSSSCSFPMPNHNSWNKWYWASSKLVICLGGSHQSLVMFCSNLKNVFKRLTSITFSCIFW